MEFLAILANSWKTSIIFVKIFVLNVWLGSEYVSRVLNLSSNVYDLFFLKKKNKQSNCEEVFYKRICQNC